MKIKNIYFLFIIFLLCSCHGKRLTTKNFMPIDNFSELNGRYTNDGTKLGYAFNIRSSNYITCQIIDLHFKDKDSLIVSYFDIDGYKSIRLKGKTKKNFFEIYFDNKRLYLFPLLVINNIDRIRIGKDKDEKLLIYKWAESYGVIIPLGAAGTTEDEYQQSFSRYDKDVEEGLYSVKIDEKWGYANNKDSIVIAPVYDWASPFDKDRALVSINNKWGVINKEKMIVIPLVYDTIIRSNKSIMVVSKNGKWGVIDSLNNEITPIKYDKLLPFGNWRYTDSLFMHLAEVHINNKIGFINEEGIEVIPIEYDKIEQFCDGTGYPKYVRTTKDDKYGYISANGVLIDPIFEKAGKCLKYNGFSPQNKTLIDNIGRYSEVIYRGDPYLLTESGVMYKYKKLGFFKENRLEVDFQSGFYLKEK